MPGLNTGIFYVLSYSHCILYHCFMATPGRFNEFELEFIAIALKEHGAFLDRLLKASIHEKKVFKTNLLKNSIATSVSPNKENPQLSLNFYGYGRAFEIAWHRSKNFGLISAMSANREKLPEYKKKTTKRDTRWYASNVYGSLNRLIGHIMYGLTDNEIERIKTILHTSNPL